MAGTRRIKLGLALTFGAMALGGCSGIGGGGLGAGGYSLVRPARTVNVGNGAMSVVAPREWNRADRGVFTDIRWVEDWTLNGPYLDGISFVSALPDNHRLLREDYKADRQVPRFRSNMTPPEVVGMVESLYRVAGGATDFRTLALVPRTFLETPGFQLDYEHLDGDELWRKGRVVGAVIDGRLYLIMLDAARSHYYAAALPDFEAIVASARRRR